jgi:secreted trypsin-like serine protease
VNDLFTDDRGIQVLRQVRRTALIAGVTVAALLGMAGPALAVADGTPATPGQYRFAVKLTMTDIPRPDGSHYDSACSAALIRPQWIVTAGHCFHDVDRNPVSGPVPYHTTATLGVVDLADPHAIVVNVVWVRQSTSTDIAVARLDRPVSSVPTLALSTSAPTRDEILRLAGWGADNSVDPVPGTHLMTGQVQVSSVTTGTVGVHGYAPAPDTSACVYDSGAPYFLERPNRPPVLVSVESFGPDCPHDQEETTSRVDDIAGWIRRTTG